MSRASLPTASPRRGFFVPEDIFDDTEIRTPRDRGEVAARLGGRAGLQRPEPRAGSADAREPLVPARDAAVPVGPEPPHGPRPQLHDGRRPDPRSPAERLARRAADGLGRVRAAGGERRDPRGPPSAGDDQPEHRDDARPDEAPGLGDRLGARGRSAPADLLPLDAVAVPAVRRTRPLLPPGGARQLVPQRPDGDRQRVRRRRPVRALRRRGRAPEHDAVVHADDRVRRRAARVRPAGGRLLARADEGDPAQLDRPLRGRRDPLPRRGDRGGRARSSRRAPTRFTARRSSSWRPSIRSSPSTRARRRRSTRATPARGRSRSARRRRRRPASSPASTWSTRSTANGCRSGSPTTS